ncbi:Ger(x)C family spore germination protein [Cohnella candidum]|uniref:Ger(X)C family spore germination protein n=1 Tax=Cohnella candidum TaxID=2674991 RepID=A0A3G3JWE4_9BACL|nr:Ger(x)C family spore germination protein [Cohnella candidum]
MGLNRKRRKKTGKLLAVLLAFVPLVTGCWDRLELEERAVILGVAVDRAEPDNGESEDDVTHMPGSFPAPEQHKIRVTVQIALPGKIPLGPGEGGGGGGKPSETLWVIGVTGHTIDDAMMNLQQQISSLLFFGHLRAIVVSEEVAREGITNLNDFLRRNPEVRRMAWMMISQGKAEQVIRTHPPLERVPTMYLISTLDNAVRMGKFPQSFMGNFWSNSSKLGQEGLLPYVKMMSEQNMELAGLAAFRGDTMVGASEPLEIAAYMAIKHINPGGYRGVIQLQGTTVTIYATHRSSKIRVYLQDGEPRFSVKVSTEINVEEKTNELVSLSNDQILNKLEELGAVSTEKLYLEFIHKTQRWGSDIFGFGEYVRAKKSNYWNKNVKTMEKWQMMYNTVPIDVDVDFKIRRVGMKAK